MGKLKVSDGSTPCTTQNLNLARLPNEILEEQDSISDVGFFNGDFEENTTVHIENSSDVVIGPVTQFHGPVTIVNRSDLPILSNGITLENKCDNSKIKTTLSTHPVSITKKKQIKKEFCKLLSRNWKLILIVLSVVLFVVGALAFFLNVSENDKTPSNKPNEPNESEKYIIRKVWGGRQPLSIRPLAHPTPYVLITHTVTKYCETLQSCSEIVRNIQSNHVNRLKSPDIGSNFLIGGDGNIYIGRGWDAINFHTDRCVSIAFIGDYTSDELTSDQIDVAKMLIKDGVYWSMLDVDYKLVNHNQTDLGATSSPGRNVYKETITWDHFLNGSNIDFFNETILNKTATI